MSQKQPSFYSKRRFPFATIATVLRQLLGLAIVVGIIWFAGNEVWEYLKVRDDFPKGSLIGGVEVANMGLIAAEEQIIAQYSKPILVRHNDQAVEILPVDAGFTMSLDQMLEQANVELHDTPHWKRFLHNFSNKYLPENLEPDLGQIDIPLVAQVDQEMLDTVMVYLGNLIDRPASSPILLTDSGGTVEEGSPGFEIDVEPSKQKINDALYQPYDRTIVLDIIELDAPTLDISYLETVLQQQLEIFDGTGSLYILDLNTGEEIRINSDDAISGLSVVKIAIMLETLRVVDGPLEFDTVKLLEETAINSGNYSANLLLDIVAGENNAYLGVDVLTASMQRLGLENTFIVTPYEEPPRAVKPTLATAANTNPTIDFDPDPAMQTTATEIGRLLGMIYDCSQGGGTLIAVYGGDVTPDECQYLIELMAQNDEGNLIRFGVPEDVPVAHKHGWAYNTHGDAGIVLSSGADYVIVQYLYKDTDWLGSNITFPILRELSRTTYNYFNAENPYVDHKRAQKAAGIYAAQQAIGAAEERYRAGE